jgi:hypothetical protein
MTVTQFKQRRVIGQIRDDEQVRTVIWRTAGSAHEWVEIFVHSRKYFGSIAEQESEFRRAMGWACVFVSPYNPAATVRADLWVPMD